MDTPANNYVRELIARNVLDTDAGGKVRGNVAEALDELTAALLQDCIERAGNALGRAVSTGLVLTTVPVFFATNRPTGSYGCGVPCYELDQGPAPVREGPTEGAEHGNDLKFRLAGVTIPQSHKLGELETASWWRRFTRDVDTQHSVALTFLDHFGRHEFSARLAEAGGPGEPIDLLIFGHGYHTTFDEAARRAAQAAYDLKFRGAVVLFSWPSLGHLAAYNADEDRAAASAEPLAKFLQALEGGPWNKVHLLAHSMGNRVMILGLADNPRPMLPLGQMVLAAADIYVDLFEQKFPKLTGKGEWFTSYASKRDRALLISSFLHRAERVGLIRYEPYVTDGLETIDATAVDTDLLGHSYFGNERSVLTDLGYLLREGFPAQRRGLERVSDKKYWRFPR